MKNLRWALFATLTAVAAQGLSSLSLAQRLVNEPAGLVPSISFDRVEPILREAGMNTQRRVIDGTPVMVVQANGRILNMQNRACDAQGECAGLWMFAFLDDAASPEALIQFNQMSKPARANLVDGRVTLDRYLIADYGTTRGTLAINVGVFAASVDQWFGFNQPQTQRQQVSFAPLLTPSAPDASSFFDHQTRDYLQSAMRQSDLRNKPRQERGPLNDQPRQPLPTPR
ncbi:MAG: YbjN domain-containing protein [Pseudomonadota bacterium]